MSDSAVVNPGAPALTEPNIWGVPGFREFMASMVLVTLANQIQGTVVAYQIYELTRDPLSLGAVGLAEALPFIAFALFGGHVADARDRRRVSLAVLYVMVAVSAGLLLLSLSHGALGAVRHKFLIYSAIVILGVCRSFLQPARAALNAELLPPSLYAKAIAIRTSFFQLAMFAGPAGGGLLYAAVGPHGAYLSAGLLLIGAWVAMYRVPKVRLVQAQKSTSSIVRSIREGFSYLASDRLLLSSRLGEVGRALLDGVLGQDIACRAGDARGEDAEDDERTRAALGLRAGAEIGGDLRGAARVGGKEVDGSHRSWYRHDAGAS